MHFAKFTIAPLFLAASLAAHAQYAQPQPYNQNDPQNYSYPAQGQDQDQQRYDPNTYDQQGVQQPLPSQQIVQQAPPELPQYDQPEAPGDGYLWTPGYWAFGPGGYYWVDGAWVVAPYQGALWTPGYWGYGGGGYFWNVGYWGPTVGFYGGINYGFGYFGTGFYGGYWSGGRFFYNREYNHGRFGFGYNQRFNGVGGVHPGGQSFSRTAAPANGFRGGSYNQRGFTQAQRFNHSQPPANGYNHGTTQGFNGGARQGYSTPQQSYGQRPGYGQQGYNRGSSAQQAPAYNRAPTQQAPQQRYNSGQQSYGGGQQRQYSAPQQSHAAPSYSSPSGGGSHGGSAPSGGGGRGHR